MTTLEITPRWKDKTAKLRGTVAAGEHVSVTVANDGHITDETNLRLRVVGAGGKTLAQFPLDDGDAWDVDAASLACTLNLNTVQMLASVPPMANAQLLFVLDDAESNTLYFKDYCAVTHWPRRTGEDEPSPTDLDDYADLIEEFRQRLHEAERTVGDAARQAEQAAESVASALDEEGHFRESAARSAENAAASAAASNTSAGEAQTYYQAASSSASVARLAREGAEAAVTSARTAQAAAEVAKTAAESANEQAQVEADRSESAANNAAEAKNAASVSASNAARSQSAAETAAVNARSSVDEAREYASQATGAASLANGSKVAAAESAQTAGAKAAEAAASADAAQNSAESAAASATRAEETLAGKLNSTALAPAFKTTSTYPLGARVTYNGDYYRCTSAVTTPGAWNPDNWGKVDLTSDFVTLAVTAETRDGATVTGQTVTLSVYDEDTAAWVDMQTAAYNGSAVALYAPQGAQCKVRISDTFTTRNDGIYDHFAPSEWTGTPLIDMAVTLVYLDAGDNPDWHEGDAESVPKFNIRTLQELKRAVLAINSQYDTDEERVAAGLDAQSGVVGVEIPDTWTKDDGTTTINDPLIVVDFGIQTDENGDAFVGATLMRKWATVNSVQFDNRNQEYAAETVAQEGVYYYGYATPEYDPSATYAQYKSVIHDGKWYLRSASGSVTGPWDETKWAFGGNLASDGSGGWRIPEFDPTKTYSVGDLVWYNDPVVGDTAIYKCSTAVEDGPWTGIANWGRIGGERLEADMTQLSVVTGETIDRQGYIFVFRTALRSPVANVKAAIRYGHNNWGASAYRQYLNKALDKGLWYERQHAGQIAPTNLYTVRGYMAGCSAELLGVVRKVKVPCYANSNTDSAQGAYTTTDTFFLSSGTNMCGNVNAYEGHAYPYMARYLRECLEDGDKGANNGRTVLEFPTRNDFPAVGTSGVVYWAAATNYIYAWRDDTNAYTGVLNNDDGSYARDHASKTILQYENKDAFPSTGETNKVYFDQATKKAWQWKSGAYSEITEAYYVWLATRGMFNKYRRRFSVTNHGSAVNARLRSSNRGSSFNAWNVYTTGNLSYGNATNAHVGVPACVIG